MTPLRLALLSLTRRAVPSLIALIAIGLAVACSGVLIRLYILSDSRFNTMGDAGDAIIGAKSGGIEILLNSLNGEGPYPDYLPYVLFESLRAQQAVHFEDGANAEPDYLKSVIPVLFYAHYRGARVVATDETFFNRPVGDHSLHLREGRLQTNTGDLVVGSTLAMREHLRIGESIDMQSWGPEGSVVHTVTGRVSGILEPTGKVWDRMMFGRIEDAQASLSPEALATHSIWGRKVLNYYFVYLKPSTTTNSLSDSATQLKALINGRTVGQVVFVDQAKRDLFDLTGKGRQLGFLMTAFIILLGGLSVAAMLVTRFDGMSVQVAVLRAIGYGKREISAWLLCEGALLGIGACVLGACIDAASFPLIRDFLGSALPAQDVADVAIWQSAPVWLAALTATIFAVFIPLLRFYRQDVHISLRSV
jgi:putative ABC transport system permease protein